MKQRFSWYLLLSIGIAFVISGTCLANPPGDALWQRAVAVAEAHKNWVPGTMFTRMEQLDTNGKSIKLERSWYRLFPGPEGKVAYEPVKVLQNGRDITKAMKKQAEALKKEGLPTGDGDLGLAGLNPFAPENQQAIIVQPLDRKMVINGRSCLVYDFSYQESNNKVLNGTAWIEEGSGVPQKIQYAPGKMPQFIRKMKNTVWYKKTADGAWVVDRMLFDAVGQYLVIKKRLRTFVKYDKYWLQTTEQADPENKVNMK